MGTLTVPSVERMEARQPELRQHTIHDLEEAVTELTRAYHHMDDPETPPGSVSKIEIGTEHGITVFLSLDPARQSDTPSIQVKFDITTLARSRRTDALADASSFFAELVAAVQTAFDRYGPNGLDSDAIDPRLMFQGRDVDAYYTCRVPLPP